MNIEIIYEIKLNNLIHFIFIVYYCLFIFINHFKNSSLIKVAIYDL